ncbi:BF3164 family lipoprotein [Melioribacteraceae bacterium 4301-Me]|uniref:BF3164 family lipoprotein n=1 Tax=Pyranulibacter aquaticus TaxID=3163344 RepID=UPI00359A1253
MRIKFVLLSLILVALLLCTCTKSKEYIVEAPIVKKTILEDSSYISFAYNIIFYKNKYYVSDLDNYRVLILDTNLTYVNSIGKYGKGPGEFTAVTEIYIDNDTLYAFDPNKNKFNVFSIDGNFIKELEVQYPVYRKFFVSKGQIVFCHPYSEEPIVMVNKNGELISSFGHLTNKYSDEQKYSTNQWDVLYDEKNIVLVNITDPVIDIYTNDLSFVKRIDLSDKGFFASMYEFKNEKIRKNASMKRNTFSIIKDSYLSNNKVYMVYFDRTKDKTYANKLLIYDYKSNNLSLPVILMSSTNESMKFITAISVHNGNVVVYDRDTGVLAKYKFSQEVNNEKL